MYVFICPLWRPRHLRIEGSLESNHLVASNMGSVSCLNKTKPEEDWKRDEERLSFLTSPPQSATEKDFHGQPCFFCLFVRFVDIWLRTEFKAVEAGKRKKKERQKKKKKYDETKDDGKQRSLQISCCYFYKRQLLIVKFVFFFLEKAEIGHTLASVARFPLAPKTPFPFPFKRLPRRLAIHDLLSCMTQL